MSEHVWRHVLGGLLGDRFPRVCPNCLLREDAPEASQPCDQLTATAQTVNLPAEETR